MYKFVIRIHICIFWWSFSYGEILGEILYQLFLFWEMLKILLGRKNAMILRVCGLGSAGLIAGLDDLTVLFQPKWFYDFVFRPEGPGSACNCSLKILLFLIGRQEWSSCLEPGISVSHSCGSLWWHSELTLLMFLVFGGFFLAKLAQFIAFDFRFKQHSVALSRAEMSEWNTECYFLRSLVSQIMEAPG